MKMAAWLVGSVLFVEMQMAASVACSNGLGDIQGQSHLVGNAAVTIHGHVTEQLQFLALVAQLLPGLYKGTLMELCNQVVMGCFQDINLHVPCALSAEERLAEIGCAFRVFALWLVHIVTVDVAALADCFTAHLLGVSALLFGLVIKKGHPGCPVLYGTAAGHGCWVGKFRFVVFDRHCKILLK